LIFEVPFVTNISRDHETSVAKPAFDVIHAAAVLHANTIESSCNNKLHLGLSFALNHISPLCGG
jgi:hypothetical protein